MGAFHALWVREHDFLHGVCRRITGHDEDARDAAQEALLALWLRAGTFRGGSAARTWLYRIATNAAIDLVRRRARQPLAEDAAAAESVAPGDVANAAVARHLADWALRQLTPDLRTVLVLWGHYGLSYKDMAEVLEISIGTVSSRVSRGCAEMRKLLGLDEPGPEEL